jgi:TrmH family RNA methyltransferase
MAITSLSNERIKFIKKLMKDKDYLFLDSPKLIEEAIKANCLIKYFISTEKQSKFEKIYEYVNKCGSEIIEVSDSVFKTLSNTVWSQGIIAITLKTERTLAPPSGNYLVLDEVQDPGNVGTLIRSGLGSGFEDIYLLNCASLSNDKVVRSTMGAIFRARIYELSREKFLEFYSSFKNKNLLVADMVGDNLYKTKIKTPCGLVIGNEGNGVSKEIRKIASGTISIPMKNQLESLNASVAGSIIMFQILNQN